MKFKYYMRGFGTGLIAATIILMIAGKTGNNNLHAADSRETETAGSVIAFTTQSPSETATTTEAAAETTKAEETIKTAEASTTVESTRAIETTKTVESTKAESTKVVENTTGNSVVSAAAGGEDGELEVVFSEVHTASQAVDILYDAGIIADKEEFSSYMEESGYDRKIRDGIYQLKPGDSYEAIAQTITQTN